MSKIKIKSEYHDLDKYDCNIGSKYYCKKGTNIIHNSYGPAVIWKDGTKFYYINNKLHKLDGPAIIWPDGYTEYCINGEYLSKEQFEMHPERLKFLGKDYLLCLK